MTDELLYERFAISAAHSVMDTGQAYGGATSAFSQLYPLVVAPAFRGPSIPADLHAAHLLNAWLMASACVPAFVLARRVVSSQPLALAAAVLAVGVPWMVYASFLLTEVLAYPVFLWACVAIHSAVSKPSTARDAVAVLAVIVAFFTRAQFVLLAVVLPVAVASFELRRVDSRPPKARIRGGIARVVERHRLLTVLVGIAVAAVISLAVVGKLHAVLGSYGGITRAGIPHGVFQGLFEHLATLALALGVLPMIVAAGWITPRVWKDDSDDGRAFACVAATTILVVLFAGTIFDLHLGAGQIVYDRYLFYAAPLVLVAAVAAFETAPTWPGMIGAGAAIAVGFVVNVPPAFEWQQFETLNADAPATAVYRALTEQLHGLGVV